VTVNDGDPVEDRLVADGCISPSISSAPARGVAHRRLAPTATEGSATADHGDQPNFCASGTQGAWGCAGMQRSIFSTELGGAPALATAAAHVASHDRFSTSPLVPDSYLGAAAIPLICRQARCPSAPRPSRASGYAWV
jgi:hypothetical protein